MKHSLAQETCVQTEEVDLAKEKGEVPTEGADKEVKVLPEEEKMQDMDTHPSIDSADDQSKTKEEGVSQNQAQDPIDLTPQEQITVLTDLVASIAENMSPTQTGHSVDVPPQSIDMNGLDHLISHYVQNDSSGYVEQNKGMENGDQVGLIVQEVSGLSCKEQSPIPMSDAVPDSNGHSIAIGQNQGSEATRTNPKEIHVPIQSPGVLSHTEPAMTPEKYSSNLDSKYSDVFYST